MKYLHLPAQKYLASLYQPSKQSIYKLTRKGNAFWPCRVSLLGTRWGQLALYRQKKERCVIYSISVKNWTKFNPRSDVKSCTWYRQTNDFFTDPDFYGASPEVRLLWIYILCAVSKKMSGGTAKINLKAFCDSSGISVAAAKKAIATLFDMGCCENTDDNVISTRSDRESNIKIKSATDRQTDITDITDRQTYTAPRNTSESTSVREAYSNSYLARYGIRPIIAAKENSLIKRLIGSVGLIEAERIAGAYPNYNDPWHVKQKHPLGLLVSQLDKVRVELNDPRRMLDAGVAQKQLIKAQDSFTGVLDIEAMRRRAEESRRIVDEIKRQNPLLTDAEAQELIKQKALT